MILSGGLRSECLLTCVLADLLLGAQEDCQLTVEEQSDYPHCTGKMNVSCPHYYTYFDNYDIRNDKNIVSLVCLLAAVSPLLFAV